MAAQTGNIDILLIGKTGNGKSATGNSILGRKSFHSVASATSVTKKIHCEYAEISGRGIKVVDGPGVGDTDLTEEGALDLVIVSVQQAIAANPEGYHAFCIVVRYGGRFTKEDQQTIQLLKGVFGEEFVKKFCILVVTCGDNFDPEETNSRDFKDWCYKQTGVFRQLVDECGGRVILFDNRTKEAQKINEQRESLIKMIDSVSVLGLRYTDENFKRAQRERDRIMVESREPVIKEETLRESSIILQHLGEIQLDDPEVQLEKLRGLQKRVDSLLENVKIQDKDTGVLQSVLRNVKNIKRNVEEQVKSATTAIDIQKEREKNAREMDEMRAEMEQLRLQQSEEDKREMEERMSRMQAEEEESRKRLQDMVVGLRRDTSVVQQEYREVADDAMSTVVAIVGTVLSTALRVAAKLIFKI